MPFAPPRAAYIHVPFCVHRCGYCNFAVVAERDDLIPSYFSALKRELKLLGEPRPVDTLYFGGGTPTYFDPARLRELCELVLRWHPLTVGYEWTVEANPADLDVEKVAALADCGVNRLSLGAQSFRDEKLQVLERDHRAADVAAAIELAKKNGMRVSLDLLFAAPGETLLQWHEDLEAALALEPNHVSTYGLTFEQGTMFWNRRERGELAAVIEELEREMYLAAIERLTAAGFEHYEISNFARPGERSLHNEVYWSGAGYYAAGPGAARYVDGVRETNHRSTTTYLKRMLAGESPVAESERLGEEARAREFLVFSLRRLEGIDAVAFSRHTGFDLEQLAGSAVRRFEQLGLLSFSEGRLKLTREGLLISDGLWPDLL